MKDSDIKIDEIILRKAERLIRETNVQNYIKICLDAGICPNCGLDLKKESLLNNSWIRFTCSCGYKAER